MILSADDLVYVAHKISRYIADTDRDYFVFDQIEAKMWQNFGRRSNRRSALDVQIARSWRDSDLAIIYYR